MKIRTILPILLSLFLIVACKNEESKDESLEIQENYEPNTPARDENRPSSPTKSTPKTAKEDSSPEDWGNDKNIDRASSTTIQLSEGKYIKDGETDGSCECYCVEVSLTGITELCLKEETIFINARMARGNGGVVNIFLVEPAARNTEGEDIPWEDFDKNIPIATFSSSKSGKMELDWLGFTINGDLAMDYAIFGKKTLEGDYKKK